MSFESFQNSGDANSYEITVYDPDIGEIRLGNLDELNEFIADLREVLEFYQQKTLRLKAELSKEKGALGKALDTLRGQTEGWKAKTIDTYEKMIEIRLRALKNAEDKRNELE